MAQDARLNNVLKWSLSAQHPPDPNDAAAAAHAPKQPTQEDLAALFGGQPSPAELIKARLATVQDGAASPDDRATAWDDLEQLVESHDNANLLESLKAWPTLVALLKRTGGDNNAAGTDADAQTLPPTIPSADDRHALLMACWVAGTAVQNNRDAQAAALRAGVLPPLWALARAGPAAEARDLRRKACYALSSMVRNFQPGMDEFVEVMGEEGEKMDASDMEAIDALMAKLRAA